MGTATRGSVLSLRLSDREREALRVAAEARGTGVSELVRSMVAKELSPSPSPRGATTSGQSAPATVGQGVFWQMGTGGATASGGRITTTSPTS
ncbi:ribbon-helix-helix domain-containing protein [Xylanimonas ulmi]|uniref:Uncharacterized protein n=1 Tax=Xylanimonas ulmi TaxID=228973 RepID=A0A4V2EY44_9MICO|nr:ribbon-helix-helix domain-containing protein [Xylanibacterium ulmi]RZS61700.1 hypothetical protein EV386_2010 [Xylanibacterium ulmi]